MNGMHYVAIHQTNGMRKDAFQWSVTSRIIYKIIRAIWKALYCITYRMAF